MVEMQAKALIELTDLRKTFYLGFFRHQVKALQGVSFTVQEGSLFGFIGPNGAGKSTTIKCLLGLIRADSGQAVLMGQQAGSPLSRKEVGYLPEQPYFYDYLTGLEFLRFYGKLADVASRDLSARISWACELAGFQEAWMDRKLRTYSKGMLQRIGLAQALLGKPRLLILDEPMSGLDPLGRRDVRELLKKLNREGVTIFYSSHVLGDVEALCSGLAMIVDGTIRRWGTVDEVLEGEKAHYVFTLEKPLEGLALPPDSFLRDGTHIEAYSQEARDKIWQVCSQNHYPIASLEKQRKTLEDILTLEAGKLK